MNTLTFKTEGLRQSALERVREAERALTALRYELEGAELHSLAAYIISVHTSRMLVRAFESIDQTPARAGRAA
jgi:hypothetical protein